MVNKKKVDAKSIISVREKLRKIMSVDCPCCEGTLVVEIIGEDVELSHYSVEKAPDGDPAKVVGEP